MNKVFCPECHEGFNFSSAGMRSLYWHILRWHDGFTRASAYGAVGMAAADAADGDNAVYEKGVKGNCP